MIRNQRKQLFTTIFLLIIIAACVGAGWCLRHMRANAHGGTEHGVLAGKLTEELVRQDQELALQRYQEHTPDQTAKILTHTQETSGQKAAILFYGDCGDEVTRRLLAARNRTGVDAGFFLSVGTDMSAPTWATDYSGCEIGVLNDGVSRETPSASGQTLTENLAYASTAIQTAFGVQPASVLVLGTVSEEMPYAAYAAYYNRIYVATRTVEAARLSSPEDVDALVQALTRGDLLAVDLSGDPEKAASGAEYLLEAMAATNLNQQSAVLLSQFDGELCAAVQGIHTVQRAVSFTFSGMGSQAELESVLQALDEAQGRGIFFLTSEELRTYEAEAIRISERGHTLGLAVSNGGTQEQILEQLLVGRELLEQRLGVVGEIPVQCALGAPNENLLQAAQAGGFRVLSYDLLATQFSDVRETAAEAVLERIAPEKRGALTRGKIVHFQLGFYQNSDTLLGELVALLALQRNVYEIIPATEILADTEDLYTYPVPQEEILPQVKDAIHPGQLADSSFATLCSRYIGTDWVDRAKFLPGFSRSEIRQLDKTGLIPDAENQIFLTFDDWGTDGTITRLLDVLRKHDAKATFFIRTNYVKSNPNLVRAIAADGHAIGSHTNQHLALSNYSEEKNLYEELTPEQIIQLQEDMVASYETLQSIVGDMQTDGKPVLCRLFRPPTLAVSKSGLETVLDCGFTYFVSGSYATQDYEAKSVEQLYQHLKAHTRSGAILIMHMSDTSQYTAEALDLYLTDLENSGKEYQFCRLNDVLPG